MSDDIPQAPEEGGEAGAAVEAPAKGAEKQTKAKSTKRKAPAKGKDKKEKKSKDGSSGPSVANHPRAKRQVRRAKGWGGLAGFLGAAYLSYRAGVPPDQIGMRALAAGAAGYMVAWACSVSVWRHLVLVEMRELTEKAEARRAELSVRPRDELATPGGSPESE